MLFVEWVRGSDRQRDRRKCGIHGNPTRRQADLMTRGTSAIKALVESSRIPQLPSLSVETRQQLQMAKNGVQHLSQPSIGDWEYNWSHISRLFSWLFAGELEAMQQFNPTVGFVSTPNDGIGAGFTEAGRLCSLSFPHTGFTHQVPFYVSGDTSELGKPLEGGFGGIEREDTRRWFWDDGTEHDIEYRPHSGILDITTVCDEFHITESAYVYPGSETLVRDYTIQNPSSERRGGTFVYHTRANVNDNDQTFALWNSNRNRLDGGTDLRWNDRQGPYELRIWCDAENSRTETDGAITLGNTAFGKYLDGRLLVDFSIPSGDTREISVFMRGGIDSTRTTDIESDRNERQAAVESWWDEWVADLVFGDIPDAFIDLYIRSAITLGMLVDPQSGSLSASPNLQPMYYPSWVRDNAFGAIALVEMGKPELATELLADFCPSIQEDDGSFRQCYNSRGEFTGIIPVENDQQPLFAWAVWEVYQKTGDERFLNRAWPAVKRALDYTIGVIDENGLLAPTPDIAEYPRHIRQSLWTNAFAYRGLLDGAMIAELQGVDGEPYRDAAETIGDAIERELFGIDIDSEWEPGESTRVRMNGGQVVLYDVCAIHPTEWASEYDRENRLFTELSQRIESEWSEWVPGSLLTAAMLYSRGEREQGDELVAEMGRETTETGYLAETRTRDGNHYFASPLAWSHAAFIYALSEMYIE